MNDDPKSANKTKKDTACDDPRCDVLHDESREAQEEARREQMEQNPPNKEL